MNNNTNFNANFDFPNYTTEYLIEEILNFRPGYSLNYKMRCLFHLVTRINKPRYITLYRACSERETIGQGRWYSSSMHTPNAFYDEDGDGVIIKTTFKLTSRKGKYKLSGEEKDNDNRWGTLISNEYDSNGEKWYYIPPCTRELVSYEILRSASEERTIERLNKKLAR